MPVPALQLREPGAAHAEAGGRERPEYAGPQLILAGSGKVNRGEALLKIAHCGATDQAA